MLITSMTFLDQKVKHVTLRLLGIGLYFDEALGREADLEHAKFGQMLILMGDLWRSHREVCFPPAPLQNLLTDAEDGP